MKTRMLLALAPACAAAMTLACGCASKTMGRVITGSAGVVTVVPNDGAYDDRAGVEGVKITVREKSTVGSNAIVAEATSGEGGWFSFETPRAVSRDTVEVTAQLGTARQRGTVVFPGAESLLLVILPERDVPAPAEPDDGSRR
ncbi:MAG: hypothetical protein ACF8R7_11385 [Phycisphaerales bacterium JB039]